MKGCFVSKADSKRLDFTYGGGRRELFGRELELCPQVVSAGNLEENRGFLRDVEVILATWNMESFTSGQLEEYFPSLKLVLYAAGSVQYFARPFLERGVRIVSSWGAMAIPVSEFTLGQILLANKGTHLAMRRYREVDHRDGHNLATERFPGTYGTKIGILGAGMIGSLVIRLLASHSVEVVVFDPFISEERVRELGVRRESLETVFRECQTISNHIANNDRTVGMLDYSLFRLMKDNAAFINTGRGAQVVEADLARALREKPDRSAILDVTWPEPCPRNHEFWSLPNVFMTPHIAGYAASEVLRMADYMLEEFHRWKSGEPLKYEVTLPMLATMA